MEYLDAILSNRGAYEIPAQTGADERRFRLTGTHYGVNFKCGLACFMNFLVSIGGKLCWTVVHRADTISKEEGYVYANCIKEILSEIDFS